MSRTIPTEEWHGAPADEVVAALARWAVEAPDDDEQDLLSRAIELIEAAAGAVSAPAKGDPMTENPTHAEAMLEATGAALEVLAIGGNGEGCTINDAVVLLRYAIGDHGVNDRWTRPVSDEERRKVAQIVGEDVVDALATGVTPDA